MADGKTVLVVGGAGFVGFHAVKSFLSDGYKVTVLALPGKAPTSALPPEVQVELADLEQLTDDEVVCLVDGHHAVVYAAGADDRLTPPRPASDFFYRHNVEATRRFVRLARAAGAKRAVIVSSYFLHCEGEWPALRLAERHPYIRSRQQQAEEAVRAGGDALDVMILELPYVFGSTPDTTPLWRPLVRYLRRWPVIFYTKGGTNVVSVDAAGQAIVGAVAHGRPGERYVVGGQNMTWPQMLSGLMEAIGVTKRIVTLPTWLVRVGLSGVWLKHRLARRESGLNPLFLADLQTRRTFFDPEVARRELRFETSDMPRAFRDTVAACNEENR